MIVVALLAAVASYVLMVCVATKLRPFRGSSTDASTAVAHRTAVPAGGPAEEPADAVQGRSLCAQGAANRARRSATGS